jgi:hypothetical protein
MTTTTTTTVITTTTIGSNKHPRQVGDVNKVLFGGIKKTPQHGESRFSRVIPRKTYDNTAPPVSCVPETGKSLGYPNHFITIQEKSTIYNEEKKSIPYISYSSNSSLPPSFSSCSPFLSGSPNSSSSYFSDFSKFVIRAYKDNNSDDDGSDDDNDDSNGDNDNNLLKKNLTPSLATNFDNDLPENRKVPSELEVVQQSKGNNTLAKSNGAAISNITSIVTSVPVVVLPPNTCRGQPNKVADNNSRNTLAFNNHELSYSTYTDQTPAYDFGKARSVLAFDNHEPRSSACAKAHDFGKAENMLRFANHDDKATVTSELHSVYNKICTYQKKKTFKSAYSIYILFL